MALIQASGWASVWHGCFFRTPLITAIQKNNTFKTSRSIEKFPSLIRLVINLISNVNIMLSLLTHVQSTQSNWIV